jgi:enamine deaminase RidA (YjgF/YER057c/UK114 family)
MTPEKKLADLKLELHAFAVPETSPLRAVTFDGATAYVSGQPPARDGKIQYFGNVGEAVSIEDGYLAAQLCALNILGALKQELGELDRIDRIVKLVGFVSCSAGFTQQSQVVNGASELFVELFGAAGRHARSAIGVASLPAGMAVEVEAIVAFRADG